MWKGSIISGLDRESGAILGLPMFWIVKLDAFDWSTTLISSTSLAPLGLVKSFEIIVVGQGPNLRIWLGNPELFLICASLCLIVTVSDLWPLSDPNPLFPNQSSQPSFSKPNVHLAFMLFKPDKRPSRSKWRPSKAKIAWDSAIALYSVAA